MKPFSINRKSWHYKLNQHFFNEDYIRYWESQHNNFCAYWRATILRVLFASLLFVLTVAILSVIVVASIADPIGATIVFGSAILVVTIIIGLAALSEYIQERNRERAEKGEEPKTVIGKQYRVWKSKICPYVEYK